MYFSLKYSIGRFLFSSFPPLCYFFFNSIAIFKNLLHSLLGNELALTGGSHLREGNSTPHGGSLTSSPSPLRINERDCGRVLSTSAVACEFSVTFTHNRISFTSYCKLLVMLIDFAAVIHLPLVLRERFSVRGDGGERGDGQAEHKAITPPALRALPGKMAPSVLSCLVLPILSLDTAEYIYRGGGAGAGVGMRFLEVKWLAHWHTATISPDLPACSLPISVRVSAIFPDARAKHLGEILFLPFPAFSPAVDRCWLRF